jgi:hypothetical protein
MRVDGGGLGRQLVAPHTILATLRWLLSRTPRSEPLDEPDGGAVFAAAVMLVNATGASFTDGIESGASDLDEVARQELMLTLMNLGTLGEQTDVFLSIARTARLWAEYEAPALARLGRSPIQLLQLFGGVEPLDMLAVGFALLSHITAWEPGDPILLEHGLHSDCPPALVEAVLALIGVRFEDAQSTWSEPVSEFDLLALESHPVLIEPGGLLVLDRDLLWRRCTSGLYWTVHDAIKVQEGEQARLLWTQSYAEMVELFIEDALRPLAPSVFGGGTTFYTEEDFEKAYGQIARCDMGIDFGERILLVEIVSGQLSVRARVHGDLKKLADDIAKLVLDKCKQLDSIANAVFENEEPLTGIPAGARLPRLVPALVVGGGLPLNPLTVDYIRTQLKELELFEHPRFEAIAILDLEDVEVLEGLAADGLTAADLLVEWQQSEVAGLPLVNYLTRSGIIDGPARPSRTRAEADHAFAEVRRRLGFPATDHDAG